MDYKYKTKAELIKTIEEFFSESGKLKDAALYGGQDFEYRPQQQQMAVGVGKALTERKNLCIEAPTGVGKSLAYLFPALLYSLSLSKPVLITTETIPLQEQLINKDIPLLKHLLLLDFSAAIAKGKTNYLCLRRLEMAVQGVHSSLFPNIVTPDILNTIVKWTKNALEGSISEINFPINKAVWDTVCCEHGNCMKIKCKFFKKCFYWSARRKWETADIIITNHALFFIDLALKNNEDAEGSLLPEYAAVIFDEAHTMEESAAKHLGYQVTEGGMAYFLRRLFNPQRGSGLFIKQGEIFAELRRLVSELHVASSTFFDNLRQLLISKVKNSETTYGNDFTAQRYELRITKPNCVDDMVTELIARLHSGIKKARKKLTNPDDEPFVAELTSLEQRCATLEQEIVDFLTLGHENFVYWIEMEENRVNVELHGVPVKINELLKDLLFEKNFPVVITSATLSVKNSLDYFISRVGADNCEHMILNSPFDYKSQINFFIPRNIPLPSDKQWLESLPTYIKMFIELTQGKAFVLFTGYKVLFYCAEALEDFFKENNIKLIIQRDNTKRSEMIEEFRENINSVIFGTSSFWTGVDVPGEALSNVIITKLPFHVPSHPLIAARHEVLESENRNAFLEYTLPEAVIKLRQGFGRLIRNKKDTGIIAVLDRRIVVKYYGKHFLNSLPVDYKPI